jgi:uncharacterized protein (DUF1330 family)
MTQPTVSGESDVSLTLCVMLWAREGAEQALIEYEDRVLHLAAAHGGRVLQRGRTEGGPDEPFEVQFLEFPSRAALDAYMWDGRRTMLAADREMAIARTDIFEVRLV